MNRNTFTLVYRETIISLVNRLFIHYKPVKIKSKRVKVRIYKIKIKIGRAAENDNLHTNKYNQTKRYLFQSTNSKLYNI
jgi:hypothetical protein